MSAAADDNRSATPTCSLQPSEYDSTFWDLLDRAAEKTPERPLLTDQYGRRLNTHELRAAAERTATHFARRGITAGSVVSWQLPTSLEGMVVMVALARLGAVQNPVLPLARESELRLITRQLNTDLLIVPNVWRGFDHRALAHSLSANGEFDVLELDLEGPPPTSSLRLPEDDGDLPPAPTDATEPRWVYFTSGTTAAPKGVRHADRTVIAGCRGIVEMSGASTDDVNPVPLPITHIGGAALLAASLLTGMRLVLFDNFDPSTPWAIAEHRPTFLGGATPFFVAYLSAQSDHGTEPLFPEMRACLAGGAPITPDLSRRVREQFGVAGIANSWGLTEFPVATSPKFDADPWTLDHTVGPPVPGVQLKIVGRDDREVTAGKEGELRLRGPQCFLGYVDSALDGDAFDSDGWFRSGDLGRVDDNGNVHVTGRIKDTVVRNAENISALEVENALITHPSVADVAVIGVPDFRTGERVCAVVVPAVDQSVSLEVLVEHCRSLGLSRHKQPEHLWLIDELPRNALGKVIKKQLRQKFEPSGGTEDGEK